MSSKRSNPESLYAAVDTYVHQPVATDTPRERMSVDFAIEFNRKFHAFMQTHNLDATIANIASIAQSVSADVALVRLAQRNVLDGSQDAVLARHHGRRWDPSHRKRMLGELKHGRDHIDVLLRHIDKLREMADSCESALKESQVLMAAASDSYSELEKRFAGDK